MNVLVFAAAAALVLVAGCGTPAPPPQWLSLVPEAASPAASAPARLAVAVGRVGVPEEVDRPELVIRRAGNDIVLRDDRRWSEPLKAQWPRALALALARRLPDAVVTAYPAAAPSAPPPWRLNVDVQRFELQEAPAARARLRAVWTLKPAAGDAPVVRTSEYEIAAADGSPHALAAAMAQAVERLADEVAIKLR